MINKFKIDKFKFDRQIVLFGAGNLGILVAESLKNLDIKVDFFYDSDDYKRKKILVDVRVLAENEFLLLDKKSIIIICNNYIDPTYKYLIDSNFQRIFDCNEILERLDFNKIDFNSIREKYKQDFSYLRYAKSKNKINNDQAHLKRLSALHLNTYSKYKHYEENFSIKYLDIVVTERCSMKCIDCSNLMQYYHNAKNSDYDELIYSINRLMEVVDHVYEFRVIGGEPFVNRDLYKILNHMVKLKNLENIVIYTNAQHIPKGELLESLKNKKIKLDITNYKLVDRSKNHDKLIEVLENNNIEFVTHVAKLWTDSGRIKFRNRTSDELTKTFLNCCVNDVLTILNGKVYRCPFSANAHNLKAIEENEGDYVNISNKNIHISQIKDQLISLYTRKEKKDYISACNYCGGRDFTTSQIKAAIQTKQPITF